MTLDASIEPTPGNSIERSAVHRSFSIERRYPASPSRVFHAWADQATKARWFACHDDWQASDHQLDFRNGGRESLRVQPPGDVVHAYDAVYFDIVPDQRILYGYEMHLGTTRISVSLTTVELAPIAGGGTRLTFTEQVAFLDGYDDLEGREAGTRIGLENLANELAEPS